MTYGSGYSQAPSTGPDGNEASFWDVAKTSSQQAATE